MAIRASRSTDRERAAALDVAGDDVDLTTEESLDLGNVDIEALWEEHRAELHRICAKIVGDPATADDMVQETYLRALKHVDKLEDRPSLMPWLATVARRRSLDEIRARKRVSPFEFVPEDETPDHEGPAVRAELDEAMGEVGEALRVLNDRERRLLQLQVHDGLSLSELADEDGSTVHSVRSVLVRARAKLRTAITQDVGVPAAAPLAGAVLWLRRKVQSVNVRLQQAFSSAPLDRAGEVITAGIVGVAVGVAPIAVDDETRTGTPGPDAAAAAPSAITSAESEHADAAAPAVPGNPSPESGPSSPLDEPVPGSAAVDVLVPPDDVESTDDAAFTSFAVSDDGSTVLAAGTRRPGCVAGCTVLFRSSDSGSTWERLPAEGITGTTVAVAPGYPSDPRIFAVGEEGLSVSRDGGETFALALATGPAPLALSPDFAAGDERVFIGSGPALVWDDATRSATPLVGPPSSPSSYFAFEAGYPSSGRLIVGSAAAGADDFEAAVFRCRYALSEDSCIESTNLPGLERPPAVSVVNGSDTVLAWAGSRMRRSVDGARTFSAIPLPDGLHLSGVTSSSAGVIYAATHSPSGRAAGVLRSDDDGQSWTVLGEGTPLADGVTDVTVLPDSRVLAAPLAQAGGDIYCSADRGTTWDSSCG